MYANQHQMEAGKNVRLINTTDHDISNIMWLDLPAKTSIGLCWNDWLMLQANEGVSEMLTNKILEAEFCD